MKNKHITRWICRWQNVFPNSLSYSDDMKYLIHLNNSQARCYQYVNIYMKRSCFPLFAVSWCYTTDIYKIFFFYKISSLIFYSVRYPYMYIQLDHNHKLQVFNSFSYKVTTSKKRFSRIYYSPVLLEPLTCDSRDNSEQICQRKFLQILISTSDKWVKY